MKKPEIIDAIKKEGIKDPESPTDKEKVNLLEKASNDELDDTLLKEYFNYSTETITQLFKTLNDLASQNSNKEYVSIISKSIEVLNNEYKASKTEAEKVRVHRETLELFSLIKKETDDQRTWLTQLAYGAFGAIVVLGGLFIATKNKELGKKILEQGISTMKIN